MIGEETLDHVCTPCQKILLDPKAFATLFRTGLRFEKSLSGLRSTSKTGCYMCALLRYSLLEGIFTGGRGDEDFRLSTTTWNSPVLTFTLNAAVDNEKLGFDFAQFDVYVAGLGPMQFWGKSRHRIISLEAPDAHVDLAKNWIYECTKYHQDCQRGNKSDLPTRLLDVSQVNGSTHLKLYENDGAHDSYVAWSYCWGEEQPAKLTSENFRKYIDAIEETTLPKTIRDSISITRALGIRYLWVDAYCILQDSEEDKQREIGNMTKIYQNSFLTIIAARAQKASDGFLDPLTSPWLRWSLCFGLRDGKTTTFILQEMPYFRIEEEPISDRAWTFQERLLSPRIISFLSRNPLLEWRCEATHESNAGPLIKPYCSDIRLYSSILPRDTSSVLRVADHRLCYRWAKVVNTYSNRALTVPNDKLPAIGGIAQEFSRVLATTYCAGLWSKFLLKQLLWYASGTPNKSNCRPEQYRAPTWSWASIEGPVTLNPHPYHTAEPPLTILRCDITLHNDNVPFGRISSGVLTIQGRLKKGLLRARTLFDVETKQDLASVFLDMPFSSRSTSVWCLLAGESSEDWEVETSTSQTSQEYPQGLDALLLIEEERPSSSRVFRRIGITHDFSENSLDWFKECVMEAIDII